MSQSDVQKTGDKITMNHQFGLQKNHWFNDAGSVGSLRSKRVSNLSFFSNRSRIKDLGLRSSMSRDANRELSWTIYWWHHIREMMFHRIINQVFSRQKSFNGEPFCIVLFVLLLMGLFYFCRVLVRCKRVMERFMM